LNIRAVPLAYKGIKFRSSLEADWAATFDTLGIYWQYEPMALQLPSGQRYLPDFYLPNLHTWAEVKGPHWERLDKAVELREAVNVTAAWVWQFIHVVPATPRAGRGRMTDTSGLPTATGAACGVGSRTT
jgi:hypothetical protein